ncbi:MAG TPA: cytochrome C oxidase subunit IV family protein, partial [Xanthobacteraceae bacterium]|nr:cytochrome C oxidase subunit IV family protein [Xanthobacteraceae bacterium]
GVTPMRAVLRDPLVLVWTLLVGATALSATVRTAEASAGAAVTVAVLVVAFVKAWVVMFTYMDVRHAPFALRALCTAWLAIVLGILLAAYAGGLPRF